MKKKSVFFITLFFLGIVLGSADNISQEAGGNKNSTTGADNPNTVTETWTYTENFENRDLGAWASYPHWQDLAYDQNFRVNELVPGDPNISLVQKVTPYTSTDNYAGAQKLLDMYLVPGATVSFRFYLKTNLPAESFKVRFAAGDYGKIDVTIPNPGLNKWVLVNIGFDDFVRENPSLSGKDKIKIYALAFLAKIPDADPDMPIYLGLDDITFKGARATAFRFSIPEVVKLPEYSQYISKKHYHAGDYLNLQGQWALNAKKVIIQIESFTGEGKVLYKGELAKKADHWILKPLKLDFPDGLYLGKLSAYNGTEQLSETEFTIHIAPENTGGKHPRLLYDEKGKNELIGRFKQEEFKSLYADILKMAKTSRERTPVKSLVFDLDQFPDEDWLPTWSAAGSRIFGTSAALRWNSMAYAFHGDREAGIYAKDVLVQLAGWPNWSHPWQTKRGRFSDHRMGSWSHAVAETYDLTYDLMTPDERTRVRKAILANIVDAAHRTYVDDDNITAKTSNWIAMIVGGSLMNMAAMYDDGPETENMEPYFTGAMIKFYEFIKRVTDSKDGAWGEGKDYNNYSFSNMSYSVPSLRNVFNIDVTAPLVGTYNEYIWGGLIKDKQWFEFGDSGGPIGPASSWAFLLSMRKEPRLSWYYNYLKEKENLEDVYFDTKNIPQDSPFDENPVKVFHEIGTTVFKSGWEKDDMSFVMRTGPFYNHQHLDQGSFWLADRGVTFIEERHLKNSNYYDDPLYQPWLIQPVGHSTILIDGNHQSQRAGDHKGFAPGFDDYAFIAGFLDGKDASFSSGDIGRLYWDKVKSLRRNVLFIKPRTLLMLDVAEPGNKDAAVSLLYQTLELDNITADKHLSKIKKQGVTLNLMHLAPEIVETKAVETPHYLKTLQTVKPLKREGMLTVTASTNGGPLVMANLLTTTTSGVPDVKTEKGKGFISGISSGKKFAFSTQPGTVYKVENIETDAVAITWSSDRNFVAMAKLFRNEAFALESDTPITFELSADGLKYYHSKAGNLRVSAAAKPSSVKLNGVLIKNFVYDKLNKLVVIEVPAGEGVIVMK